ncbi:MAG: outer membrane lipoprotein-sorting protein [Fusobacteriota bacterium]
MKIKSLVMLMMFLGTMSFGQDFTGYDVMKKVYTREESNSQSANMKMILENKQGNQRIREIKQFKRDFGDVEKSIMFFISPADVRDTSFMNWTYDNEEKQDDQWIYLPALRRVRRISSDNKSDSFMGSDFSYDDLGKRNPVEDNHKILRSENLDGKNVYVIESIPKDKNYIYSKTKSWVVKDEWIGLKKEFYDKSGKLLKILEVKETKKIDGIITITNSQMKDIQKNHKTIMKLDGIDYGTQISENKFTERMMRRGF